MEKVNIFLVYVFMVMLAGVEVLQASVHHPKLNLQKLFVFGDSYADTGNLRKVLSNSWKVPYGVTFPGKPTGRFSDGRVLTDFLARFQGIHSPIPYRWRKVSPKSIRYGMNFAYGGTGVFDTLVPLPNMTTQIDMFQKLIQEGVYSVTDLQNSLTLVSVAGNDYTAYQAKNGTLDGIQPFITSLINQLETNLKRISDIGLKKIAVTGLQPLGCLPASTITFSFQKCNDTVNKAAMYHNLLLQGVVEKMNRDNKNSRVVILNLFQAFISILQNSKGQGRWKFENSLKPCCLPISSQYNCGSINANGTKMYTVCERPESAFFWDSVHPTQMGWTAVSTSLRNTLYSLSS